MSDTLPYGSVDELFAAVERLHETTQKPPVHLWHPEREGDIDIRIAKDGTWWHEGKQIRRQKLVRLFASILRLDADGYCLVTPAERLRIEVEDAPFVGVDLEVRSAGNPDQALLFRTNLDDYVVVDAEHRLEVVSTPAGPRPYLDVRSGLRALVARSVYYRLVEFGEELDEEAEKGHLWVRSRGQRFSLGAL